jgi:hypothetical protein
VILDHEFLHARDDVEVTDLHVVGDAALARVDNTHADAHAFTDFVSKEPAIKGAF